MNTLKQGLYSISCSPNTFIHSTLLQVLTVKHSPIPIYIKYMLNKYLLTPHKALTAHIGETRIIQKAFSCITYNAHAILTVTIQALNSKSTWWGRNSNSSEKLLSIIQRYSSSFKLSCSFLQTILSPKCGFLRASKLNLVVFQVYPLLCYFHSRPAIIGTITTN